MAVKVRLSRIGRRNLPAYRIVVADSRSRRDGRHIEDIGFYSPTFSHDDGRRLSINLERMTYWLSVGAQKTDRVAKLHELFLKKQNG